MGLFSFFQGGAKYFDKKIDPKCDYCSYGKRTKDGNRVLCEKRGLVEQNYSCKAFIYSPLKRIPVKQLRFVGSIADDDLYIESKGDRSEKEAAEKKPEPKKAEEKKPAENVQPEAPKKEEEKEKEKEEAKAEPAPNEEKEIKEESTENNALAAAAKAAEEALQNNVQA